MASEPAAAPAPAHTSPAGRLLGRMIDVRPAEVAVLGWAWLFVFSILFAYYVLRPIRDEMGVHGGVQNLAWLFTATLLSMLAVNPAFSALVKRLPRVRFISVTYRFFMLNLAVFAVLLALPGDQVWLGRVFFVWTSVFNLFVVTVFWAFMVDVFDARQGKRLFGFLAAGATLGAIAGSSLTAGLVEHVGTTWLLAASIVLLEVAVFAVRRLSRLSEAMRRSAAPGEQQETPIGGSVLAGLTHTLRSPYLLNICAFILLYSITSTFLYFQQASIVSTGFPDRAARTLFFARVDLMVNLLTLAIQLFLTARILRWFGVALTLGTLPLISALGFAALAMAPAIAVLVAVQVLRRAGNFALARPAREILFTVLPREDKYKAKAFIDTFVYRGGDVIGAQLEGLLGRLGMGLAALASVALPLALLWAALALWLGRTQQRMAAAAATAAAPARAAQDAPRHDPHGQVR